MIITEGKSNEQIVIEIVEKLIDQGGRCMNKGGGCAYGNEYSHHCAIGWLLPEDDPVLMTFIGGVNSLRVKVEDLGPNGGWIEDQSILFLDALQSLHDSGCMLTLGLAANKIIKRYPRTEPTICTWIELRTNQIHRSTL